MKLFGRKDKTAIVPKERPITVAVPDIKEYLVREYERVNELKQYVENLENKLEQAKEVELKYEATLVTLDEYSKRIKLTENKLVEEKEKVVVAQREIRAYRDEVNTYKIRLHDAALTKESMRDEIISEFKNNLVENFNAVKGNLSKSIVAKIINETGLHPTEKGGVKE